MMVSPTTSQDSDRGSGNSLSPVILLTAGIATVIACVVTATSIWLQLKNYRKPVLQRSVASLGCNLDCVVDSRARLRMVIRIMIMVPLYAVSSLIALFSLEAAFVIDAIRDIYEVGPRHSHRQGVKRTHHLLPRRPSLFIVSSICLWRIWAVNGLCLLHSTGGRRNLISSRSTSSRGSSTAQTRSPSCGFAEEFSVRCVQLGCGTFWADPTAAYQNTSTSNPSWLR